MSTAAVAGSGAGMRVELPQHEGCPSAPAALHLVRQCLSALRVAVPVLVRVGDYPSPTVLVDGTDVMGAEVDVPCHLSWTRLWSLTWADQIEWRPTW